MQTTKATIKLIDQAFRRVVVMSDQYGAFVLYRVAINGHKEGDEITLFREDNYLGVDDRRKTPDRRKGDDWQIELEGV